MFTLQLILMVFRDMLHNLGRAFTPRRLTLYEVIEQADGISTFRFQSKNPLQYEAGQYGIWFLPQFIIGKPVRLFTVASAPGKREVEFTTRMTGSPFKRKLAKMSVGKTMYLMGPIGRFVLPETIPARLIFIAGGIGVTPYPALVRQLRRAKGDHHATLVYVARPGDFVYKEALKEQVQATYYIEREELASTLEAVKDPSALYYVSGPPLFVKTTEDFLRQQGIQNVLHEGFLGY